MGSEGEKRFEFGANWTAFVEKHFDQERLDISRRHLLEFVGKATLDGLSFLDIGCGSGLHSLAAWQAGARPIHSFDYDPKSVEATRLMHQFAQSPAPWTISQGSVLDAAFMEGLSQADLVYSWGVLHHTGDVWSAIHQACSRVSPGGLLYLALYSADLCVDPPPAYWLKVKQRYVAASPLVRRWMEWAYLWRFRLARRPWRLGALLRYAKAYKASRGMSFMTDVRDWLGGWPMEFCLDADVVAFVTREPGMKLEKMVTGEANTEFLFSRAPLA